MISKRYDGVSLVVYPEKALQKGLRGVGSSHLTFSDTDSPTRVYVAWEPEPGSDGVLVKIGQLDEEIEHYAEADEWAMWPVYQCAQCGRLVQMEFYKQVLQPGPARELHRHRKQAPVFIDTLIVSPMQALVSLEHDKSLRYVFSPDQSIDRYYALEILEGATVIPPGKVQPASQDDYRYATAKWVMRYRHSSDAREIAEQIVASSHLRQAMTYLDDALGDSTRTIAADQIAAGRFLAVLREYSPSFAAMQLDRYALQLAILLRSMAYRPVPTQMLLREIGLEEQDLIELLDLLDTICPELLSWALTWAEMFYLHAIS